MMRGYTWFAALALAVTAAQAGTIQGRVRAEGKAGVGSSASGAYESRKLKFATRIDYTKLKDFVVYIEGEMPQTASIPPATRRVVIQRDAVFSPHVTAILQGTTIEWPNEDDILHNVFSFSDTKSFDLGLYRDEVKKVTFDKPGRVDIFCSIHAAMHCIILVMENPYFCVADEDGRYEIRDVPAGTYTLKAWHERLPPTALELVVPAEGTVSADFTMGIKGLPEY